MFCPNCGKDCGDAKFCSECGQALRSTNEVAAMDAKIPEPPVGRYEGTFGYVELGQKAVTIHKKILFKTVEREIPYQDLVNIAYQKATGLGTGFLAIREKKDRLLPIATSQNAASDETALCFGSTANDAFYGIYQYLMNFVELISLDSPIEPPTFAQIDNSEVEVKVEEAIPVSQDIDMEFYFQKYHPYRGEAIKAVRRDTGMSLRQAKDMVDEVFDKRQKELYATSTDAALRDLKRIVNPKKTAFNEKKAELDKLGQVYCPKCLSTSVTANQKGFGIGKAVIGAAAFGGIGLTAGNIGSKKIICTCLKCGHQWKPGKK